MLVFNPSDHWRCFHHHSWEVILRGRWGWFWQFLLGMLVTFTRGGSFKDLLRYVTQLIQGGLLEFSEMVMHFSRGGGVKGFLLFIDWFRQLFCLVIWPYRP